MLASVPGDAVLVGVEKGGVPLRSFIHPPVRVCRIAFAVRKRHFVFMLVEADANATAYCINLSDAF